MTSASLFFKLQREDLKRRVWAAALLLLSFFFAMPVGLSMAMENAVHTNFRSYSDGLSFPIPNDGSMTEAAYLERLTELKTRVVLDQAAFGNGLIAVLLIAAAVVVGASGFSYLHNRRKVDFYHSIPVRRELLFAVQYLDGILLTAAAYLFGSILLAVVASSYGVSPGSIVPAMLGAFLLQLLFFALMYSTVVLAMMMTGNLIVGLLATAVFFLLLPGMMLVLSGYCETFFVTTGRQGWGEGSFFAWGLRYLSPLAAYITAIAKESADARFLVRALEVLAFLALSLTSLLLYRIRPSEAAGRAMAFEKSRAPIRILLVVSLGLSGGLFFWMLQSRTRWGLFGAVAAVLLTHGIVEIIYSFDFKKLFSHRLQLAFCLGVTVLIFLAFRHDWFGYDSYLPDRAQIASVSLDISSDAGEIRGEMLREKEGRLVRYFYEPSSDSIDQRMELTDLDTAMLLIDAARRRALEERDLWLGAADGSDAYLGRTAVLRQADSAGAVSVIGGADGPTSVWLAGKTQEEETLHYPTRLTVCYHKKDGRSISRSYQQLDLADVMDTYQRLYSTEEYKEGAYYILGKQPEDFAGILYRESEQIQEALYDPEAVARLLAAYQKDLRSLTVEQRMKQYPIGQLSFVSTALDQQSRTDDDSSYGFAARDTTTSRPEALRLSYLEENAQFWPVYASFSNTIREMRELRLTPGSYLGPDQIRRITVDVSGLFRTEEGIALPEGEEREAIQAVNPAYSEDGTLSFDDPEAIRLIMSAAVPGILAEDPLNQNAVERISVQVYTGSEEVYCILNRAAISPELEELFRGLPVM